MKVKEVIPLTILSGFKIATQLCQQLEVEDEIEKILESVDIKVDWEKVTHKILELAERLNLHKSVKKQVINVVQPIASQMLRWMSLIDYRKNRYNYKQKPLNLVHELHWTTTGTIDHEKTASLWVSNKALEFEFRYMLACLFCFSDDVDELWQKMDPEPRKRFYAGLSIHVYLEQNQFVDFWTGKARGKGVLHMDSTNYPNGDMYASMCKWAIRTANGVAFRYFFNSLKCDQKATDLEELTIRAITEKSADIMCYLLSIIDEQKQESVLKVYSFEILMVLYMSWPWQIYFISISKGLYRFLSETQFKCTLSHMAYQMQFNVCGDEGCLRLCSCFWEVSPMHLKKSLVRDSYYFWEITHSLRKSVYWLLIKVILRSATAEEIRQLANSTEAKKTILTLIAEGEFHFLIILKCDIFPEMKIKDFKNWILPMISQCACVNQHEIWWNNLNFFLKFESASADEVRLFKKEITKTWRLQYVPMIEAKNWYTVDMLLSWQFSSEAEIIKFKQDLVAPEEGNIRYDLIFKTRDGFIYKDIETIMSWCKIFSPAEKHYFKIRLLRKYGIEVCHHFIRHGAFCLADFFLTWFSLSPQEISYFKMELWEAVGVDLTLKTLELGWRMLEMYINWIKFSSEEEIINYKKKIWDVEPGGLCICTRLLVLNVEIGNLFLNMTISSNSDCTELRRDIAKKHGMYICVVLSEKTETIDSILNWCRLSECEKQNFKRYILFHDGGAKRICLSLVQAYEFQSAETFLFWCSSTNEDILTFKRVLLLSEQVVSFLKKMLRFQSNYSNSMKFWMFIYKILWWFNPSDKTVAELTSIFESEDGTEYTHNNLNRFLAVLKEHKHRRKRLLDM